MEKVLNGGHGMKSMEKNGTGLDLNLGLNLRAIILLLPEITLSKYPMRITKEIMFWQLVILKNLDPL